MTLAIIVIGAAEYTTVTAFVATAATTTTVSATSTVLRVVLSSPTAIVGDINGSSDNYDDQHYALTLPFPITYGQSSANVQLSINRVSRFQTASFYETLADSRSFLINLIRCRDLRCFIYQLKTPITVSSIRNDMRVKLL